MNKKAQANSLFSLLTPRRTNSSIAHNFLFAGQLALLIIFMVAATEAMLYINKHQVQDKQANQRYSMLQAFADRINFTLQQQQLNIEVLNSHILTPNLYDSDTKTLSNTQKVMAQLRRKISFFNTLVLLSDNGQIIHRIGKRQLPGRELIEPLTHIQLDDVLLSPMHLSGETGQAHVWAATKAQANNKGIAYVLVNIEVSELWSSFYTIDYSNDNAMFLVDQQGQYINLTESGKRGRTTMDDHFPGLWNYMETEGFGRFDTPYGLATFIELRPGSEDKIYALSLLDAEKLTIVKRYEMQFRIIMLMLLGLLSVYFWKKRQRQFDEVRSKRALDMAEQLYQANAGALLFNSDGYCISGNTQFVEAISQTEDQLTGRRFTRLFQSDNSDADMIWQLARSSGLWTGPLRMAYDQQLQIEVSLRSINFGRGEHLMMLQLEERPQHRSHAQQLQHFQQLAESASGLALINNKQQMVNSNQAMAAICKAAPESLLMRPWKQLLAMDNSRLLMQLDQQLAARNSWQGQLWIRSDDASIHRCMASIQLTHQPSPDEEPLRVLTLTPIDDLSLCNEDGIEQTHRRVDQHELIRQQPTQRYTLLLLNIDSDSFVSSFADVDRIMFRHHQILHKLSALLPTEALIGNYRTPSEIDVLLPDCDDLTATQLTTQLLSQLDEAKLGERITVGIALASAGRNWETLRANAIAGVNRARMTGLRYCQVLADK